MLNTLFARTTEGDANAQSVFSTSTFLVGFSLFKLTVEVSRYWVIYRASAFPNENPPDEVEKDEDEEDDGADGKELMGNVEGLTEKGSTVDELIDDVDETRKKKEGEESNKFFGLLNQIIKSIEHYGDKNERA